MFELRIAAASAAVSIHLLVLDSVTGSPHAARSIPLTKAAVGARHVYKRSSASSGYPYEGTVKARGSQHGCLGRTCYAVDRDALPGKQASPRMPLRALPLGQLGFGGPEPSNIGSVASCAAQGYN